MTAAKTIRLVLPLFAAALLLALLLGCQPAEVPPGPPTAAPTVAIAASATAVSGPVVSTATPAPGDCAPPPAGWQPYVIQPGDTLQELSARAGVSSARILSENCLPVDTLIAGETIYLPPLAAVTPCVPGRPGWELVTIDIGDSLVSLAQARGVSVAEIEAANCLTSEVINAGERLYLPPLPTPTPCPAPAGWEAYAVQPGDTVLDLAAARNVTSAEIMAANCLAAPLVQPGQTIYLPPIPPPPPTATLTPIPPAVTPAPMTGPTQPPQAVAAAPQNSQASTPGGGVEPAGGGQGPAVSVASPFEMTISRHDLAPWVPNAGAMIPCSGAVSNGPYLDGGPVSATLYLGQRRAFVPCFILPAEAYVINPDGITRTVPLLPLPVEGVALKPNETVSYIPDVFPPTGTIEITKATSVVEWYALPFHPTGVYTLIVKGKGTVPEPAFAGLTRFTTTFTVSQPAAAAPPEILVMPSTGRPGQNLAVYYTNFPLGATPRFTLLRQQVGITETYQSTAPPWPVSIDQPFGDRGWGFNLLAAPTAALTGTYTISQVTGTENVTGTFWLK